MEIWCGDILEGINLIVLVEDDEMGMCLFDDLDCCSLYMFNYIEYDIIFLVDEFECDSQVLDMLIWFQNYFLGDDVIQELVNWWWVYVYLLFGNWINEMYQMILFDLKNIG